MTNDELYRYQISSEGLKALNNIIKYTEWDQLDGTYMAIGAKADEVKRQIDRIDSLKADYKPLSEEDEELLGILKSAYERMDELADDVYTAAEEFDEIISALQTIHDREYFDVNDINQMEGRVYRK